MIGRHWAAGAPRRGSIASVVLPWCFPRSENSGRKPGRPNKRTVARQQLASAAAEQGIMPLEVMLERMRYYFWVFDRELQKGKEADPAIIDGALKAASESAKDAAPYIHPRLSAVEHSGDKVSVLAQWREE